MKIRSAIGMLLACTTLLATNEPNTVIATIPVGDTPAGIAITPNNLFAYVANNNNDSLPGGNTVSVLNLTTNTLEATISDSSFNEPYTVTINAAGTKAYVTNSFVTTVSIIDTATNTVTGTIGGFNGPSGFAITPDGNHAYVNNYGAGGSSGTGNTVDFVDLNTNAIVDSINVGLAPAALAITPDGAYVYVVNYVDGNLTTGTISVIQTSNNTVVDTITGLSGPFGIAITPNGKYAYVTNFGSNNFSPVGTTVSVVDISTNTITATILVGIQPAGVAITPDGSLVYISNYSTVYNGSMFTDLTSSQGTVDIISTATNSVLPPIIGVGLSPANIAISPNGQFAYVSNYRANTVSVIALPYFQISAQGSQVKNKFLGQTDLVNKLAWSTTGTELPFTYSIYRNSALTDLAGTVGGSSTQFLDHNRKANTTYTYYIVGTNALGMTMTPAVVTIN